MIEGDKPFREILAKEYEGADLNYQAAVVRGEEAGGPNHQAVIGIIIAAMRKAYDLARDEEPVKTLLAVQEPYQNPATQVAFRAGFIFCREIMARFVEQGGDATTAGSIRANWMPQFGDDPGAPRKIKFCEVARAEDMEKGPWTYINPGPNPEAAVYALGVMAALGIPPTPET